MGKEETDIKDIMQTPPNQCLWWMFLCTHLSLYDSETNGMMESLTALQTIQDITQTLTSIQTYQIQFLLWRGFGTFQFTCKGLVGHDKSQIHWQVDKSSDPSPSIFILSHLVWICVSHIYISYDCSMLHLVEIYKVHTVKDLCICNVWQEWDFLLCRILTSWNLKFQAHMIRHKTYQSLVSLWWCRPVFRLNRPTKPVFTKHSQLLRLNSM